MSNCSSTSRVVVCSCAYVHMKCEKVNNKSLNNIVTNDICGSENAISALPSH